MKNLMFVFVLWTMTITPTFAQPLMGEAARSTVYGGPAAKITQANDESVVLFGARGGVIVNERFSIGAGIYRLLGDIEAPEAAQTNSNRTVDLDMDYIGLDLGYLFSLHRALHLSIQMVIGTGGAQYWEGDDAVLVDDGIFVVEPGVEAMVKITSFFRLGIGASYRFISNVDRLEGLQSRDLTDASANLTLIFGRF